MSSIFDWEVRRLGMRDTLKPGTITVSGFGYFHKNCRFLWGKKMFQSFQEVLYTIHIRHITNISDFVWFQRSCGSMKSVSSILCRRRNTTFTHFKCLGEREREREIIFLQKNVHYDVLTSIKYAKKRSCSALVNLIKVRHLLTLSHRGLTLVRLWTIQFKHELNSLSISLSIENKQRHSF